jgi:hypothetical protein
VRAFVDLMHVNRSGVEASFQEKSPKPRPRTKGLGSKSQRECLVLVSVPKRYQSRPLATAISPKGPLRT